jgi:hypothetical protein
VALLRMNPDWWKWSPGPSPLSPAAEREFWRLELLAGERKRASLGYLPSHPTDEEAVSLMPPETRKHYQGLERRKQAEVFFEEQAKERLHQTRERMRLRRRQFVSKSLRALDGALPCHGQVRSMAAAIASASPSANPHSPRVNSSRLVCLLRRIRAVYPSGEAQIPKRPMS